MTAMPNGPITSSGMGRPSPGTTSVATTTSGGSDPSAATTGDRGRVPVRAPAAMTASRLVPATSNAPAATIARRAMNIWTVLVR